MKSHFLDHDLVQDIKKAQEIERKVKSFCRDGAILLLLMLLTQLPFLVLGLLNG